jgi:hypothetical protein
MAASELSIFMSLEWVVPEVQVHTSGTAACQLDVAVKFSALSIAAAAALSATTMSHE